MIREFSKTDEQATLVGENVKVSGKLHTSSNIQINGSVNGEISSDGTVIIGKTAVIEGPITASDIKVEGVVKGNIVAKNELELGPEAKIFGDIQAKTLSVESGAVFVGKSIIGEKLESEEEKFEVKEIKKTEEEKQPEQKPELEIE